MKPSEIFITLIFFPPLKLFKEPNRTLIKKSFDLKYVAQDFNVFQCFI